MPSQQVGRQRRDVEHRVVELLGVRMREAEDHPAVAFGGHRGDVPEQLGELGRDGRVARAREGEHHVAAR